MQEWTSETAEWYADKYGEYATNHLAVDRLALAPDATVVDIGCGTASALRHAAARVTTGALIGVDPTERMVQIARERLSGHPAADRIQLHVAPAHALPVEAGTVDVVLAFDSYDHWGEHKEAGLREVRRVLAPAGRFAVVKDADAPGAAPAKAAFVEQLQRGGFRIVEQQDVAQGDVTFTLWIAQPTEGA
ncbi:MAG: class I SAM-dependent methyltransferase [Myxococcales bacterium]|nr:class I SAM-dependent methyltransferase [Myxococcales bacterium]